MNYDENNLPEFLSVVKMAEMLNLSRSRFYQLIDEGVFLKPVQVPNSKRPVFTKEMIKRNLEVKFNNVGVNGKIVMFYSARNKSTISSPKKKIGENSTKKMASENQHFDLIEALESLGLENVSEAQIDSAIKKCFPDGTENIDEDEILAEIFRLIKVQNAGDNVGR